MEIRAVGEHELRRALEVFFTAMVGFAHPADGDLAPYVEDGRTFGAFEGDEMVGTATSQTGWLAVPGGRQLKHAAVTDVGVLPTHTRQGIFSAVMKHQLRDAVARGVAVATLRATEAVIYEHAGYGIATSSAFVDITTAQTRFRPGVIDAGPVRLVPPRTSWDLLRAIYDHTVWPGAIGRSHYWWNITAWSADQGDTPRYVAVHGPAGQEDGFVRYQSNPSANWMRDPDRSIRVTDIVAHTPQAQNGLLRFLLGIDLVHRVEFAALPVDHSIEKLLLDERAVRSSARDETWLRLLDVEAALAARSYRGPGSVVVAVSDPLLAANNQSFTVSGTGARPTSAAPDLSLDVAALACLYLGGTRWWQLSAAGRVAELTPGAVETADRLFQVERVPFAGTMF